MSEKYLNKSFFELLEFDTLWGMALLKKTVYKSVAITLEYL